MSSDCHPWVMGYTEYWRCHMAFHSWVLRKFCKAVLKILSKLVRSTTVNSKPKDVALVRSHTPRSVCQKALLTQGRQCSNIITAAFQSCYRKDWTRMENRTVISSGGRCEAAGFEIVWDRVGGIKTMSISCSNMLHCIICTKKKG